MLGKIEIFQKYNGEKVLTINSYPQGVSIHDESIKKSYWYAIAQEVLRFTQKRKKPQILMLGLGACTIPNLIAKQDKNIHQTIIEIDKEIIKACHDFFGLGQLPNYQIIQNNAYKWVSNNTFKNEFDVIIIDIFLGHPPYVDLKSNKPNFIEKLLPYLKQDGMIIFNRPAHTEETRSDSRQLEQYLKTRFKKTKLLDIKDPRRFRNNLIIGLSLQIKNI
ncbi:MAG: hypothetical protein UW78_C0026G0005 [Candidatus Azambacteria bacterium GW2011_GWA1_44_9]|uniref:Spermidine synthase n=1 Tax=Candidatus Azambacteria bacterium GW2011_GWA1_44_9 TaxID=1618610 RepID=A0A0G1MIU3_9BACT|nr:MAG: hypothetical protein UW78_C0026G0005 [Candidatus Azambacteria bacterium GW2011_GWA1_44_9]